MQTECSPTLFEFEPVEPRLWPGSMAESSSMPEGCCWGGWIRPRADPSRPAVSPTGATHDCSSTRSRPWSPSACSPSRSAMKCLNDHDELRHDPLFHVLAGKLEAKRSDCAPVAGKSTLNRLEHRPRREAGKYHKIDDAPSLEALFVDIFLDGHKRAPKEIVLDVDDRRHDPRRARRSVLPWLLRQLLLPAALHLLRPVPARRQAAPRQHRRGRRRGRRGRPDRSGPAGRRCGSCCAAIRASAARS